MRQAEYADNPTHYTLADWVRRKLMKIIVSIKRHSNASGLCIYYLGAVQTLLELVSYLKLYLMGWTNNVLRNFCFPLFKGQLLSMLQV